jgi:zinc/manganese transport system ATP-binding protein
MMVNKSNTIVTAQGVSAIYGNKIIWDNASFEIKRGEFIVLLGANGAGKTTLFKILLRLEKASGGELRIFNESPTKGNNHIGFVPQRRTVDSETKIHAIEYVRLGINGTKFGLSLGNSLQKEYKDSLEALKLVDALELAHRPLNELSGGEAQRVFLAQALVSKPDLLLLDEPLSNLDIRRETQLISLISKIVKERNIAVLLIAHDINPLLSVVDRIIYIANGKVASGKPDEIITTEKLSELYGAPIEVLRGSRGQLAVLGVEEAVHHA